MKKTILLLFIAMSLTTFAKDYPVKSPDGKIQVTVSVDKQITWSATVGNQPVFTNNTISLDLGTTVLGANPKVTSAKTSSVNEEVKTVVAVKSNKIANHYNQLTLAFKPDYSVSFRLFD
ncbi:MAG TPA: glycoside hydrolase family 97 N-terminal domain-containing protein, partial [Prolixibacteraceae bacterium]|nr:glycoside hydrolase family 97 N-terminal domain-containing protein [Prolixibacteraceae bacterium]